VCAFAKLAPANGAELFLNFPVQFFRETELSSRGNYLQTHTQCAGRRILHCAIKIIMCMRHALFPREQTQNPNAATEKEREKNALYRSIESAVMQARRVKAV
jgi:hypothetical protein